MAEIERKIALFIDFENIALGLKDANLQKFDIHKVLERLLEKGKIIIKRAYCDWENYKAYKRPFHEAAIDMIEIPHRGVGGKNNADIKLAVDTLELCYSKEHLDTFAIVSGDSDFSPLVSKLRESDKYVIGIGIRSSTAVLLTEICDEFIFYDDLVSPPRKTRQISKSVEKKKAEAFRLLLSAIQALIRENYEIIWGSMVKQSMKRKRPSFDEGHHGYNSFHDLLEDAQKNELIQLEKDKRSGSYIIVGLGK